ncbi:MAG: glycosyltransferase family 4 protein [Betaproteobacteria bacterium]|nr:glycosyltransferase family 4 protein [Betaproteobacteria bacterium]
MSRILIYSLVFPPDQVSNAHVLASIVEELRSLGHEISVLTTTPHYQTLSESSAKQPMSPYIGQWVFKSDFDGIPCYHIKVPATKGEFFKRILTAVIFHSRSLWFGKRKELDCDIVLTVSTPPTIGLIGPLIAKFHKAKSVFIIWDLSSENFLASNKKRSWMAWILRCIEAISYRWNDAIVSLSPTPVKLIRSRCRCCVAEIPTTVDVDLYFPRPRNNDFSGNYGWNDQFLISYVGNYGLFQDFSPLPKVVSACSDLDVKFICAGGGLRYEELVRDAKKLNNPKWEVWGYQPIEATAMINASSDLCLILLDKANGSFPSKLYTIMASGRPVLYYGPCETDIGRLIRENDLGWTVETGDVDGFIEAVREAYVDSERREQMGRNGLKLVEERYSSYVVARKYHELIQKVLVTNKFAS